MRCVKTLICIIVISISSISGDFVPQAAAAPPDCRAKITTSCEITLAGDGTATVTGYSSGVGDLDWYRFTPPDLGLYHFVFQFLHNAALYDRYGQLLVSSVWSDQYGISFADELTAGEVVYIQAQAGYDTTYTIHVTNSDTAPQIEPSAGPGDGPVEQQLDFALAYGPWSDGSYLSDDAIAHTVAEVQARFSAATGHDFEFGYDITRVATPDGCWGDDATVFGRQADDYVDLVGRHLILVVQGNDPDSGRYCPGFAPSSMGQDGSRDIGSGGVITATASDAGLDAVDLVHELAHDMGLAHADSWTSCVTGSDRGRGSWDHGSWDHGSWDLSDALYCHSAEYGDNWDYMGVGDQGFSGVERWLWGLLRPGHVADVHPGSYGQIVDLTSSATPGLGVQLVRIDDPLGGEPYFIEYRSGTGMDAGVRILRLSDTAFFGVGPGGEGGNTTLLVEPMSDPCPDSATCQPGLHVGSSFLSPGGLVRLEVVKIGVSDATVRVSVR